MKKGAHTKQGFVLKLIIQNEKSKVIIRNYMVNVSGSENEMVTSRDFYDCRVANNAKPVTTLGRATA